MIITLVGVGLIGGSMAMDLKKSGFAKKVIGVDQSAEHLREATDKGIIDEAMELQEALGVSDFVLIAIPVNATKLILPRILNEIRDKAVVIDVGSTKAEIIRAIQQHPNRKQYVPTHPMSGTEHSGPGAALYGLFQNKVAIICNKEESDQHAVALVENMYRALGSRLLFMDAAAHDEHVAYVSHLSHVISYALAVAVLDKEKSTSTIFDLAAGGFASTARLAKSSADMWVDIFEQNSSFLLPIIDIYMEKLQQFRKHLADGEIKEIRSFIEEANKIRKVLDK